MNSQRVRTGEALSDVTHQTHELYRCKQKPFYWVRRKRYQVPRYLHDKTKVLDSEILCIEGEIKNSLRRGHTTLSTIWDEKGLLDECCWVSTPGKSIYTYDMQSSIAQNLDTFQRTLSVAREFTLCAVNISGDRYFGNLVPLHNSLAYITASAEILPGLLKIVLQDRWEGSYGYISKFKTRLRDNVPPQLVWTSRLPSAIAFKNSMPHKEPTLYGINITLRWPREPSRAKMFYGFSDWKAYVLEPHNQRPDLYSLQIVDVTMNQSRDCRVMLITTSSTAMKRLKQDCDKKRDNAVAASDDKEEQIFNVVLLAIEHIIVDIASYIGRSMELVHEMDVKSRHKPSVSKVQLLMHVNECHQWAAQACRQNAELIRQLCLTELPCTQDVHRRRKIVAVWIKDLVYLAEELDAHAHKVSELKNAVVGLIELYDKRRTRNIGFLIAIYAPLAFATSFFGMNIEGTSVPVNWVNATSAYINSTAMNAFPWYLSNPDWLLASNESSYKTFPFQDLEVDAVTPVYRSATQITTDQLESQSWPLSIFFVMAGTLTFGSMILPLIAGRVYRSIARFSFQRRAAFRMIVAFFWACLIFVLIAALDSSSSILVFNIANLMLGVVASVVNTYHKRWRQVFGWTIWICIWAVRVSGVAGGDPFTFILTIVGWVWLLVCWTYARPGHSWSILPASFQLI